MWYQILTHGINANSFYCVINEILYYTIFSFEKRSLMFVVYEYLSV